MDTQPSTTEPRPGDDDLVSQLLPVEGLLAIAALLVMLATAAMAIDDALWAGYVSGTRESQTSFLLFLVIISVLVGLALAKSRLTRVRAHAVGASVGAVVLLLSVAGIVSGAPGVIERLRDLSWSVNLFGWEVFVRGQRSSETSVFLLTIGGLLWAAGHFGAFAVFRYQRALPAIAVAAVPLLINVTLTVRGQYLHVIVFAAGALLLLLRMNLLQQLRSWEARAIGEAPQVSSAFLRAGTTFVALALAGSVTLAAQTSSAPLGSAWSAAEEQFLELGYGVNRFLGGITGEARGPSLLAGPNQTIRDSWISSDEIAFTAVSNDSDQRAHRWRLATYFRFDGFGWNWGEVDSRPVPAGEELLAYSAEPIGQDGRREQVVFTITPAAMGGRGFVAPDGPLELNQDVELQLLRDEDSPGAFVRATLPGGLQEGVPYSLLAAVRKTQGEGALTGNELAAAGYDYPGWVVPRYVEILPGSLGDSVYEQTNGIVASLPPETRDPYHIALAIQNWLRRGGGFTYTTDLTGMCSGQNRLECFLGLKRGWCEHFASTMVMMLRTQGIPSRYVIGYLPGRPLANGSWEIPFSAAHAWVEVYFPGYGWVTFDPTPGNEANVNEPTTFASGPPVAGPVPTPPAALFDDFDDLDPRVFSQDAITPGGGGQNALLLVLALAAAGLLGSLLLGFALLRRTPRVEPDLAYRGMARLAARFGYGPRPHQTAYEYADNLGELVPAVRAELRVLATAKVETTYGGRRLSAGALDALRSAYARVRVGLLRLLWRRRLGPRGPRSIE